jgi:hypothetical protein
MLRKLYVKKVGVSKVRDTTRWRVEIPKDFVSIAEDRGIRFTEYTVRIDHEEKTITWKAIPQSFQQDPDEYDKS